MQPTIHPTRTRSQYYICGHLQCLRCPNSIGFRTSAVFMVFKSRRFGPHLYRNLLFFSSCLTLVVAGLKLDFPPNIAVLCNIGEPRYLNASRPCKSLVARRIYSTMLNITTALQVNLRFNFQPACIAYPTLEQVSATVLAGLKNMKVTPRSGGVGFLIGIAP